MWLLVMTTVMMTKSLNRERYFLVALNQPELIKSNLKKQKIVRINDYLYIIPGIPVAKHLALVAVES